MTSRSPSLRLISKNCRPRRWRMGSSADEYGIWKPSWSVLRQATPHFPPGSGTCSICPQLERLSCFLTLGALPCIIWSLRMCPFWNWQAGRNPSPATTCSRKNIDIIKFSSLSKPSHPFFPFLSVTRTGKRRVQRVVKYRVQVTVFSATGGKWC